MGRGDKTQFPKWGEKVVKSFVKTNQWHHIGKKTNTSSLKIFVAPECNFKDFVKLFP